MVMTIRQFVKNYRQLVEQQIASNSMVIGKGTCKDMEEYKRKVGFNDGLSAGAELATRMLTQMEEAEEGGDLPEMKGGGQ